MRALQAAPEPGQGFIAPVQLLVNGTEVEKRERVVGSIGVLAVQSELDKSAGLGTGTGTTAYDERGRDIVCLADDRCVVAGAYDGFATLYVVDKSGKLDVGSGNAGMLEYTYPGNMFRVVASPDGKTLFATATSITQVTGQPQSSLLVTLKVGQ